ncbi:flagellar motor switch phosphatase FliY [Haloimpatiens sp. FM7330]|uniref:flagellar motor switch phosphatase FliY n=1 Tax=Haloimpatiens sp. FM7330 TaxID=3298610 RepID=UPI00362EF2A1
MSNDFLSQEEIDSLLKGGDESVEEQAQTFEEIISENERDLLGEIGNISMGSASTALSTIINQPVNITTPQVSVTTLKILRDTFEVPNISLEVEYTSGIIGENLLVMKINDAAVVASLMMGGDGKIEAGIKELSEIEESAVSEAMNQMIGSAATSMATMFAREVNISPPKSKIWNDLTSPLAEGISEDEPIVRVSFKLKIGDLIDSQIMQILPVQTAKKIVSIMTGSDEPVQQKEDTPSQAVHENVSNVQQPVVEKNIETTVPQPQVEVQKASFDALPNVAVSSAPKNIDLILDVPLQISVVLGKTKMTIKDILNLGTGSLIELDKLAEEPVEILVNGKIVAYGEVVVVDENFGVRITSIVSSADRVKSLGR